MKTELNADIATALAAMAGKTITNVFLVACGGSLSIMHPGKYFLDRHADTLNSDVYNGDEFVTRDPRRLGADSLVILCSQTGTTKETVGAAKHARERGATTIGMTLDPKSPLAEAVDHTVAYQAPYTTGIPIDAADSNYGVLYMILAGLLKQVEKNDVVPSLLKSLSYLQPAIEKTHVQYASMFDAFAERFKDRSVIYTTASGANYGASYSFSICVLMEMLWINSQAIHADEFFHGPFEVVDKNASFISFIGMDETRRLEERTRDFLFTYCDEKNVLVLDANDLDLDGIDAAFQGYLVPLIFFDALWKFAYKLAAKRETVMLDGRRYMKKITNY
ncbi:SIS domain-containing protein [Rhizobium leguminosarum]|uniref:SIS domain-containing protein n=1 Tax=Rhizobium leguminosarum TaxID=384 RepID=UPI001C905A96|nr:SIS domain-containing protein [Rhizobium leguminosarum]MBY3178928.1 SIS domain-containing protein [Rhizobium leguminosarum]MBY5645750.1 SIS domain-containing protein [Rhizobium leguminosarum]